MLGYSAFHDIVLALGLNFVAAGVGVTLPVAAFVLLGPAVVAYQAWDLKRSNPERYKPTHFLISGKNCLVHEGDPENHIAAARSYDSDGEWNLCLEITEEEGKGCITWAYGPDINHSVAGRGIFPVWVSRILI